MRTLPLLFLTVACSGGDDVVLDGLSTPSTTDDSCVGAETFVAGLSHSSDRTGRTVELASASPTPPDVGDNAWTVTVSEGAPVLGLVPDLTPWMPRHGHGLVPVEYVGVDQGDGSYLFDTFDLIMPGLWEFTIDLEPDAEEPDTALFRFCAEG